MATRLALPIASELQPCCAMPHHDRRLPTRLGGLLQPNGPRLSPDDGSIADEHRLRGSNTWTVCGAPQQSLPRTHAQHDITSPRHRSSQTCPTVLSSRAARYRHRLYLTKKGGDTLSDTVASVPYAPHIALREYSLPTRRHGRQVPQQVPTSCSRLRRQTRNCLTVRRPCEITAVC